MGAYVLSDRGTWLSFKNRGDLEIVVEGDKQLFNQYGIMLVNPAKHAHVKKDLGQQFIDWFLKPDVQTLLTDVVGTAPVLPREKVTVSDEVFGKVASSIPPIVPAFQVYIDNGDWIAERWAFAERWAEVLAK